jgi:hypothetical protein
MTGRCWRLLAAFSLLFFLPAPLSAQRRGEEPSSSAPAVGTVDIAPPLRWMVPLRNLPGIVPESLNSHIVPPRPDPVAPIATGFQRNLLQQLVRNAGFIFVGRVISVGAGSSPGAQRSATAITFQVEHALLGTSIGRTLTIHEWGGLWDRGERYRVGERVLLFLYAPSKLGFTSPVAGTLGRFAVNSQDQILLSGPHAALWAGTETSSSKTVLAYSDFALAVQRFRVGAR